MSGKVYLIAASFFILSSALIASKTFKDGGGYRALNLKVLPKDISHDELEKIMHSFNKALGVDCNHCHATNESGDGLNFASDNNPIKETARYMMEMTNDINKRHFKHSKNAKSYSQISCISCHHGSTGVPMQRITK